MQYSELGDTGLMVSKVGFGGYRISVEADTHGAALELALLSGVNLIDTSANYTDGNSEKLIGEVMERLIKNRQIQREDVIVVTKAGYLQGQNWDRYEAQLESGSVFPDIWKIENGLAHSIHPVFLADQLNRSLSRLNLATVDVFLLHNPEYYFTYCQRMQIDRELAKATFYEQISSAFLYLETEVAAGRIQFYGISSNHFAYPSDDAEAVSLDRILDIAEKIGATHFKVIQLPANVIESAAFTEENQSNNQTVISAAANHHLGVLLNRPLNAMVANHLLRLSTFHENPEAIEFGSAAWHRLLSDIAVDEQLLADGLADDPEVVTIAPKLLACLQVLNPILDQMPQFESVEAWESALFGYFLPRVEYGLSVYARSVKDPQGVDAQLSGFMNRLQHLFLALTEYYRRHSNTVRGPLLNDLLENLPDDWQQLNGLAAVAIRLLTDSPGVSSVLVGMRDEAYVTHVTSAMANTVTAPSPHVWEEISTFSCYN